MLPADVSVYKRTPTFTETTIPAGLLRSHRTRAGVWGRIVVEEGRLIYTDEDGVQYLDAGSTAVVRPEQAHEVAPDGMVRFHVEFLRLG